MLFVLLTCECNLAFPKLFVQPVAAQIVSERVAYSDGGDVAHQAVDQREPIEDHLRDEQPPADGVLVVRGGPVTAEKFLEHALRQQREYSFQSRPMASISVDLAIGGWSQHTLLQHRLWSRSTYAVVQVGALRKAGYPLLPTHSVPHYDIVLPEATIKAAAALLALFSAKQENQFKRRTR